ERAFALERLPVIAHAADDVLDPLRQRRLATGAQFGDLRFKTRTLRRQFVLFAVERVDQRPQYRLVVGRGRAGEGCLGLAQTRRQPVTLVEQAFVVFAERDDALADGYALVRVAEGVGHESTLGVELALEHRYLPSQ